MGIALTGRCFGGIGGWVSFISTQETSTVCDRTSAGHYVHWCMWAVAHATSYDAALQPTLALCWYLHARAYLCYYDKMDSLKADTLCHCPICMPAYVDDTSGYH